MKKKEEKNEPGDEIENLADKFLRDMGIGEKEEGVETPEELMSILKSGEEEPSYKKEAKEKEPLSFSEYSFEEEPLPSETPFSFSTEAEPTDGEVSSLKEPSFAIESEDLEKEDLEKPFFFPKEEKPISFEDDAYIPEPKVTEKPISYEETSFAEEPSEPLSFTDSSSSEMFSFPQEDLLPEEPLKPKPSFAQETAPSPDAFSFPEEDLLPEEPLKPKPSFAQETAPSPDAFSFPEEDLLPEEPLTPKPSFAQETTPSPDAFSFLEREEETAKSYEETPFIEEPLELPLPSQKIPEEETSVPSTGKISEIMASLEEGEKQEGLSDLEEAFEEHPEDVHHEEEEEYIVEKPPSKRKKGNILKFAVIGSIVGIVLMGGGYLGYKYLSPKVMDFLPKVMGGLLKGSIEISSEPSSADIFLDDVSKGKTPLSVSSLSLSNHKIRITKEGYLEWNGDVELSIKKRKEQITANLSLIPVPVEVAIITTIGTGTLSVKTSPVAAVYLNGKAIRRMPVVLDEGIYTITVNKAGYYTFRRQIEIKPGLKLQIVAKLSLKEGSLFIDSVPRFAEVIFEGQSKGKTPLLIPGLPSFQPFQIKIKKEGFAQWRGMTFTEPGERTKIMALLGKQEGEKKEPEKVHYIMPKRTEPKRIEERQEQRPSLTELQKQITGFEKGLKFPQIKVEEKIKPEETKFPEWTMDEIIPPYSYPEPELFKMPEPPVLIKERTRLPETDQGPGYCFITSIPAGAEILVDGKSIGKTPIRSALIGAGKHLLTARKEGFPDVKKEVTVSGEATNFFNLLLPK